MKDAEQMIPRTKTSLDRAIEDLEDLVVSPDSPLPSPFSLVLSTHYHIPFSALTYWPSTPSPPAPHIPRRKATETDTRSLRTPSRPTPRSRGVPNGKLPLIYSSKSITKLPSKPTVTRPLNTPLTTVPLPRSQLSTYLNLERRVWDMGRKEGKNDEYTASEVTRGTMYEKGSKGRM